MFRLDRPAWRALYERDVDLLLLDLLHSSEPFRRWFLAAALPSVAPDLDTFEFRGAWHSVIDALGHESDLEADWWSPRHGAVTLLIEDKVDAACQPDQALRYLHRAARYRDEGLAQVTRTVLVAPATYPLRHQEDSAPFESHVALEQVATWVAGAEPAGRGVYLAALLGHALRRWRWADSAEGDNRRGRQFPDVYAVLAEELARSQPDLRIRNDPNAQNGWVYLRSVRRDAAVTLRYRFLDQWAELALARKAFDEEVVRSKLAMDPLLGAGVYSHRPTELAVWVPTPELDLDAGAASQSARVAAAVDVLGQLQRWYERNLVSLASP